MISLPRRRFVVLPCAEDASTMTARRDDEKQRSAGRRSARDEMHRNRWTRCIALALLTWPLMGGSCADILQRSFVNGFFDAVTPLMKTQLQDYLKDLWER